MVFNKHLLNEWMGKKEVTVVLHLWDRGGPVGIGVESRIREGCISNILQCQQELSAYTSTSVCGILAVHCLSNTS